MNTRQAKRSRKRGRLISTLGRGAYPIAQATRLLRLNKEVREYVSNPSVRRWAYGYERRGTTYDPAIKSEPFSKTTSTLSFHEMVEVMFIASSLASGAKWPKVREAARVAAKLLRNDPHPFAHRRWFADPAGIYLELGNEFGEPILIEMAGCAQIVMKELLSTYLKQIRFNELTGFADSWHPLGFDAPVVVDPFRSFGQPIVDGGVRTDIIAGHHRGGQPVRDISAWYDIPEHEVRAAIEFEGRLLPIAA